MKDYNELQRLWLENYELREENRKLKESLDIATKCSSNEEDWIIRLSEENNKLKLHIEAKDKAYTALLKDYEEIKEDRDKMKTEIEEWLNAFRNR